MTDTHDTRARAATLSAYILLDRTGSMGGIWTEAVKSVNAYAEDLAAPKPGEPDIDATITLAVFDAHAGLQFDVLRDGQRAADWTPFREDEAAPRGMTPLLDAVARIVSLAEAANPGRAVIVIMTDGHENASREVTREGAKAAIDRAKAKGWEVVFLGAQFAEFGDAASLGIAAAKSMAMDADAFEGSMRKLSRKSRDYGSSGAGIDFGAEDRREAGEDRVKRGKGS
jgi:hypothetical protein